MLIGTVAGGVGTTTTINLQYVPQFLFAVIPAAPTLMQLNIADDGTTVNLDAAGFASMSQIGSFTNFAGANAKFMLANGEIAKPKGVQLIITNANAAAFNVFGFSFNKGDTYVRYLPIPLLANSSNNIGKFAYLTMPALGASDIVNVTYASGQVQALNTVELLWYNSIYENVVGTIEQLSNLKQNISDVQLIVTAAQTIYKADYQKAGMATVSNRNY